MWIEYLSSKSFGSIKTAAFFEKSDYLFPYDCLSDPNYPGDLKILLQHDIVTKTGGSKIKEFSYHGFVENNISDEFLKYDFKKLHSDSRFKEFKKVDNLGSDTKKLMGDNVIDISKIEYCMFPTVYKNYGSSSESYFKSARIDNRLVFFINVPEGCGCIELYDTKVDNVYLEYQYRKLIEIDKNAIEPAVIIRLGPKPEYLNNPDERYYPLDPRIHFNEENKENIDIYGKYGYETYTLPRLQNEINEVEYLKQLDETRTPGLLVFTVGNDRVKDINLSYISWINDSEPQVQQRRTLLGNQEYFSEVYKKDPSYFRGKNLLDRISGALLGIKKVEKTPLLNKKLKLLEKFNGVEKYSPTKEYSIGDKVIYSGKYWISCYNNNISNFPQVSNKWVLEECIQDSLNDIIRIDTVMETGQSADEVTELDKKIIPVFSRDIKEGYKRDILIKCSSEYSVDTNNIYYLDDKNNKVPLVLGSDFQYNDISGILTLFLSGPNMKKQADQGEVSIFGSTLYIGVCPISVRTFDIMFAFEGNVYTREAWRKKYGESSVSIKSGSSEIGNDRIILTENQSMPLTITAQYPKYLLSSTINVLNGDTRSYAMYDDFSETTMKATVSEGTTTIAINPASAYTVYYINVYQVLYSVEILGGEDFEVSSWYSKVPQGESIDLMIYPVEGSGITNYNLYDTSTNTALTPVNNYTVDGYKKYTISNIRSDKKFTINRV